MHSYLKRVNMKILIVIAALFTLAYSAVVPTIGDEEGIEKIVKNAEEYYKTLPKNILEDVTLKVPQLLTKYGYPAEQHKVVTKDGYILEMHRIPYGKSGPSANRSAVYLQHGILASSADWIIPGTEKGLAYILADAGYDVWMGNARGTRYSRAHISLDPDKDAAKFWDFSWHEIATVDVPAMIDHVLETTGQKQTFYIGHSQGTTVFYVMCSELKSYNAKIRAQFSLAPIGFMSNLVSPLVKLGALWEPVIGTFSKLFGMYEFLPHSDLLGTVSSSLCGDDSIFQILCTNTLFAVCGFNKNQMNATLLPVIMGHTPAGTSTKQFLHYAQEVNSGAFRKFDYGLVKNMKVYGSIKPPAYNLKNVDAPVYLHYSRNDWMSHEKDVLKLYKKLKNVKGKFLSPDNKFNHLDYVYGADAKELLYNRILGLMGRH